MRLKTFWPGWFLLSARQVIRMSEGGAGLACPLLLVGLGYFFLTFRCNKSGCWTWSFFFSLPVATTLDAGLGHFFLTPHCNNAGWEILTQHQSGHGQKLIVSTQQAIDHWLWGHCQYLWCLWPVQYSWSFHQYQMSTAISRWKHQFSSDHWS